MPKLGLGYSSQKPLLLLLGTYMAKFQEGDSDQNSGE